MNFIDPQLLPLTILEKSYNPYLVALSILIAIISSFTGFGTSERIHATSHRLHQILWLLFGAISMGIGFWAMHFIGSLALRLPISVSYDLNITLLSVVPAIIASSVVLWPIRQNAFDLKRLLFCGVLMSTGLGAMHFIGMSAMKINADMAYLQTFFALSVIASLVFATYAINLKFKTITRNTYQFINRYQSFSALVLGVAATTSHYAAMQAVVFIPTYNINDLVVGVDRFNLALAVSIVVLIVLTAALIIPHLVRSKAIEEILQENEENLKIAATAFQTQEGIMVTDKSVQIIRVNQAFSRITGYSELEVLGKDPKFLQSGKHDSIFYEKCWNAIIQKGKWSGEIWNRRKNGDVYPEWQTISVVKDRNGEITHFVSFFSDITEFKLAEKEIEKLAFFDPLTELPNRRLLHDRLEHELNMARRYHRAGILFYLDLDRFKQINDSLGHSVGDELLIETAKRLQILLRDTDTAVRLGGDEFIILASAQDGIHTDLLEQSQIIAEKIITAINSPFMINNNELFISTSIGITLYTGIEETVETLLKRADTAMYQAKENGRNTFCFYQQSMQDAVDKKMHIEKNLRLAISKNELSLHYQPQLSDERIIIGSEALIRWENPDLGWVSPMDFIPLAEETGLIIPIGEWIIETVCKQIKIWDKQNLYMPHIAINISAKQFHHADFSSTLVDSILGHKIRPEQLLLEITEGVFLGNLEEVTDKMNALKQKGFRFSIDDFGTGYSSLTYLKRLPFDQLKIDQAFIRDMVDQSSDAAIVKAIIVMAKGLDLDLIAEGVETDQHLAFLTGYGCHNYQGYFFSKPLPAEQLVEYVNENSI